MEFADGRFSGRRMIYESIAIEQAHYAPFQKEKQTLTWISNRGWLPKYCMTASEHGYFGVSLSNNATLGNAHLYFLVYPIPQVTVQKFSFKFKLKFSSFPQPKVIQIT